MNSEVLLPWPFLVVWSVLFSISIALWLYNTDTTQHGRLLKNRGKGTAVAMLMISPMLINHPIALPLLFASWMTIAWREFVISAPIRKKHQNWWIGFFILCMQSAIGLGTDIPMLNLAFPMMGCIGYLIIWIFERQQNTTPRSIWKSRRWCFAGFTFIIGLPSYAFSVHQIGTDENYAWLFAAVATAQISDALQMWIGKTWGTRKVIPWSPAKTLEGFLGGTAISSLFSAIALSLYTNETLWNCLPVLYLCSMTGVIGGLISSYMKRRLEIKDWSNMLHGHGGIIDRIDSLLITIPVCWFLIQALK